MSALLEAIRRTGIIPMARGLSAGALMGMAEVFIAEGIPLLEVTLNTPGALETIQALRHRYPDLHVGAGTVLRPEQGEQALRAGAQFLVSPHLDPRLAEVAHQGGVPWIPGALTPTEILQARAAGADLIKLFPAVTVGPAYVRQLRGPLPDIALVPTGGISSENAGDFIAAGAVAIGVGTSLLGTQATNHDWLRREIRALQAAVARGRQTHA